MIAYAWIAPTRRTAPTISRRSGRGGATQAEDAATRGAVRDPSGPSFLGDLFDLSGVAPARPRPGEEPICPETGLETLRVVQERMGAGLYYEDWPRATAAYADRDRPGDWWR